MANTKIQQTEDEAQFGPYAEIVKGYKEFFEQTIPQAKKDRVVVCKVRHDTLKEWDKYDLFALTESSTTLHFFEKTLMGLAKISMQKDSNGTYTTNAVCAQNALTALKPDCCADWGAFYDMIRDVAAQTKEQRRAMHAQEDKDHPHVVVPPLPVDTPQKKSAGPTGMLDGIDTQAALALVSNGVTADSSHDLKTPLAAQAAEAVKMLKSRAA